MATLQELQSALRKQIETVMTATVNLDKIAAEYKAFNPNQPGASGLLRDFSFDRNHIEGTAINDTRAQNIVINTILATLSDEDKIAATELATITSKAFDQYGIATNKVADAYHDKFTEISILESQKSEAAANSSAIPVVVKTPSLTDVVKSPDATNPDATAAATDAKYLTQTAPVSTSFSDARNEANGVYIAPPVVRFSDAQFESNRVTPAAAIPAKKVWSNVVIRDANGAVQGEDLRVKIRVPSNYLTSSTSGINNELRKLGGIIFPYTPSISYEHKADYTSQTPTHSNFAVYFYKNSSISAITITGKFTVQNDTDVGVYLSTVHLLRALTKMRSGGRTGDADSGAPPPVCRLDAYGDAMLANVPVAITSFRLELPDNIDYYNLGPEAAAIYGQASVPTLSTITLSCIPMYSRQEMQDYSVTDWLNNPQVRKYGLL